MTDPAPMHEAVDGLHAVIDAYAQASQAEVAAALQERDAAVAAAKAETAAVRQRLRALRAEYDAHLAEHDQPQPEPQPQPQPKFPGHVPDHVILGMSADDWQTRASALGPAASLVRAHRTFVPSWSPTQLLAKIREDHARGVLSYASAKFPGGSGSEAAWAAVAAGSIDADLERLGRDLEALGYPVRVAFHHEPRGGDVPGGGNAATVAQLRKWIAANLRCIRRIRAGAPNGARNVIFGTVDNGFPWSPRSPNGWTPDLLNQVYSDEFLAECDVLGADFYDGSTSTRVGEPAHPKMEAFQAWADSRGFDGMLDVGEWNFTVPDNCLAFYDFVTENVDRWWLACVFNSNDNNRDTLPLLTDNDPPSRSWGLSGGRLAAFKMILAENAL